MPETLKFQKAIKSSPEHGHQPVRLTGRSKKILAGLALSGVVAGGVAGAKEIINDYKEPDCNIVVQQDDTVTSIKVRIADAGDERTGNTAVVSESGERRNRPQDIQMGDLATVSGVDPAACEAVGGIDPEKH